MRHYISEREKGLVRGFVDQNGKDIRRKGFGRLYGLLRAFWKAFLGGSVMAKNEVFCVGGWNMQKKVIKKVIKN
jgi:hypothetical protein